MKLERAHCSDKILFYCNTGVIVRHIGVFYFNIFVQTRDRKRSTESCWQSVFAFVFEVISCAQFVHVCISILLTHLYLQSSCAMYLCVCALAEDIFRNWGQKSDFWLEFEFQKSEKTNTKCHSNVVLIFSVGQGGKTWGVQLMTMLKGRFSFF